MAITVKETLGSLADIMGNNVELDEPDEFMPKLIKKCIEIDRALPECLVAVHKNKNDPNLATATLSSYPSTDDRFKRRLELDFCVGEKKWECDKYLFIDNNGDGKVTVGVDGYSGKASTGAVDEGFAKKYGNAINERIKMILKLAVDANIYFLNKKPLSTEYNPYDFGSCSQYDGAYIFSKATLNDGRTVISDLTLYSIELASCYPIPLNLTIAQPYPDGHYSLWIRGTSKNYGGRDRCKQLNPSLDFHFDVHPGSPDMTITASMIAFFESERLLVDSNNILF